MKMAAHGQLSAFTQQVIKGMKDTVVKDSEQSQLLIGLAEEVMQQQEDSGDGDSSFWNRSQFSVLL
jgi:hypothetical protein